MAKNMKKYTSTIIAVIILIGGFYLLNAFTSVDNSVVEEIKPTEKVEQVRIGKYIISVKIWDSNSISVYTDEYIIDGGCIEIKNGCEYYPSWSECADFGKYCGYPFRIKTQPYDKK